VSAYEGWRVVKTPVYLLIVKGCGAAATVIEVEALIKAAQFTTLPEQGLTVTVAQ
jgi:hypothetical protein